MLKTEMEKANLIAHTIEPMIAMNHYFGLEDDLKMLAIRTSEHEQIAGLHIEIESNTIWEKQTEDNNNHINITHPIINPITQKEIGNIYISYTRDALNKALYNIHIEIMYYLGVLAFIFLAFVIIIRYLFKPLEQVAKTVKNYKPGSKLDFSLIRTEPEITAITSAFDNMLANIREYTVLLERYKHSVDESAIVVRMDLKGKITYVNNEFCRLSGYSREESLGSSIFEICHPQSDAQQCGDMLRAARAKQIWKGNMQNQRKNGSNYYVRVTVVPIIDEQENIIELVSIQQDITQVIEQQEQITRQTTDTLTGLYNRIKLEEDIKTARRPHFAIIAIDHYNLIKDYYSLDSGKQILKEISDLLLSMTASQNLNIYKLTGSEYGILCDSNLEMTDFHKICRELLEKINNHTIKIEGNTFNISASSGLTSNKQHLLSYAGLALQHAQETRHLTIIYEETQNLIQKFESNLTWTKKINHALNNDLITLHAQPIINSKTLKTEKYECLVRMIDENEKKVISPHLFLDIAKRSKLYHQITKRVITIAFDTFSKIPDVDFSINLSIEDLLHIPTIQFLESILDESGLASRFILEIVESEGIENFNEISSFVDKMKQKGCRIAIDDFGSGYSNFAYLMQLNIDYIKVDGSLIKSIDQDTNSQIITSTILDFSKQLKIKTVAEFVHNQNILDYAQKMGFDYVQGFHLGEPAPIETLLS